MSATWNSDPVERLRQYLRIPSVHPDVDYTDCVTFLKEQASLLGLPVVVHEFATGKPVVVVTWTGLQPELASILLNSHMDVVPVGEEVWTHPPFEAHITEDGWLYARGVQDMKSVGMMYLEAIRNLKQNGVQLKRTVHVSFVPDEEIDGQLGMKLFSESDVFRELNIGFALDESGACPKPNEYYAFNVERTNRRMIVTCKGNTAHGSSLVRGTAGEKIHYIINKFMTYRAEQMEKFEEQGSLEQLGNYTTINLTKLEGGIQLNVLPDILSVGFDIRISPNVCCEEFEKMVDSWCAEAGDGVTYEYDVKNPEVKSTSIGNGCLPFWDALVDAVEEIGMKVNCVVCPGATDARFVRQQGVPAINFTALSSTPVLLHCRDERIHIREYFKGIKTMERVISAVANVSRTVDH